MTNQACERQTQVVQHYSILMLTLCVLNLLSSLLASIGNSLVIYALWKASTIPANLKKLFLGLAFSDLAVGLFAQPLYGIVTAVLFKKKTTPSYNFEYLCPTIFSVNFVSSYFLAVVTFITVTAIAIDRLLAVFLHLRYRAIVTAKRVVIT